MISIHVSEDAARAYALNFTILICRLLQVRHQKQTMKTAANKSSADWVWSGHVFDVHLPVDAGKTQSLQDKLETAIRTSRPIPHDSGNLQQRCNLHLRRARDIPRLHFI